MKYAVAPEMPLQYYMTFSFRRNF